MTSKHKFVITSELRSAVHAAQYNAGLLEMALGLSEWLTEIEPDWAEAQLSVVEIEKAIQQARVEIEKAQAAP